MMPHRSLSKLARLGPGGILGKMSFLNFSIGPGESGGYPRLNFNGRVAQSAEQQTFNLRVLGSIPSAPTNTFNDLVRIVRGGSKR